MVQWKIKGLTTSETEDVFPCGGCMCQDRGGGTITGMLQQRNAFAHWQINYR